MVNLVLLAGKILFLLFLYLFIYWVIRASARDMRTSVAQARSGPAGAAWTMEGTVSVSGGPAIAGGAAARGAAGAGVRGPAAGRSSGGTWALVVEESPHVRAGSAFVIPHGARMLAGRAADVDIHLPDTFVSSHHVRVEARSDGLLVEDLGSTNGTFVNEEEITGSVMTGTGDRVTVGDSVFRVEAR